MRLSGIQIAAIAIVVIIAVAGIYYLAVYNKPSTGYFSENVIIQIGGALVNATDPAASVPATYYPENFTVADGAHITLVITNTDNVTHGLAVPHFNLDTGAMQPNETIDLSFVASPPGNYTYTEPAADCGGGGCDAGQALTGWFVVKS
jgi:heme/copper-type cytochrome/quinol oxidase subunit 2